MHRAKLRKTVLCPICLSGDIETAKHMWWECTNTEKCRQKLKKEVSQKDFDALPEVTTNCGIILDDPELDECFSILTGDSQDEEETWPPREKDDCSDFSYDSDGFLKVAGDGACPSGQGNLRLRGSGTRVYYDNGSKHNYVILIEGAAQGAQRAEIGAALRWALWAWSRLSTSRILSRTKTASRQFFKEKRKNRSHTETFGEELLLHCKSKAWRITKLRRSKLIKARNKETRKR